MGDEQPIYSINEYAPINKYIDEQSKFRQTRTFWAYGKIFALSLLAIGVFAILIAIAYWWFNKPHPEIIKHTVEVQPNFDNQYFNSDGDISYDGINNYNGDVFFEIIKQKEEIISQIESKTTELEGEIVQLEEKLSSPQINQEQKDQYEKSLKQYQDEISKKEEELIIYKEQIEAAEKALSEIDQESQEAEFYEPEIDDQGNPIALYQEYTVFEKKEIGDNLIVTTGFSWDSKARMDEGKEFNNSWCYIDQNDPFATFHFDGRDQIEQLKLFKMSLTEIRQYEKYCSDKPSPQFVS